jgi:dUTP pyrophosphatase
MQENKIQYIERLSEFFVEDKLDVWLKMSEVMKAIGVYGNTSYDEFEEILNISMLPISIKILNDSVTGEPIRMLKFELIHLNGNVKIVNKSTHPLPEYATELSAGMDLRFNLDSHASEIEGMVVYDFDVAYKVIDKVGCIELKPFERKLFKTGLYVSLPKGHELQIRPRSGLGLKKGITLLNGVCTIDADYRGEIGVILINLSSEVVFIKDGDRIAQAVLNKHEKIVFETVDKLDVTERGEGGFGHIGE